MYISYGIFHCGRHRRVHVLVKEDDHLVLVFNAADKAVYVRRKKQGKPYQQK